MKFLAMIVFVALLVSCDPGPKDMAPEGSASQEDVPEFEPISPEDAADDPESSLALEVARAFIAEQPSWKELSGRNLEIVQLLPVSCEGCFLVEATFDVDGKEEGRTDRADIQVTIHGYEAVDSFLSIGGVDHYSEAQCVEQDGYVVRSCAPQEIYLGSIYGTDEECCIKPSD